MTAAREVIRNAVLSMPGPYTPDTVADAILAALSAAGMAVVPREATEAMIRVAECVDTEEPGYNAMLRAEWRAMIAAATEPASNAG